MSNYPPGVGDNTYGAPFNDIEVNADIELSLSLSISLKGPDSNYKDNALDEFHRLIQEELIPLLKKHEAYNDLEILNIQID